MTEETEYSESFKILLADDTPMNLTLATKLLTRRGHQVNTSVNGLEAFELFQKEPFDLILMDVQMPVMGGVEATQKIREYEKTNTPGKRMPIIALTANDSESDREEYLRSGMDGVITKPLNIKTIVQEIKDIIKAMPGNS
ncbi:MAG: response regulator [Candidatus Nitrohelix vancouverensis]|uniref:Response regulator n=1 Tax=Candidatus Nitrohelix vancouverensis TaxID=2705534 RepID=A0A7T0C131_9BACT|nr:MAG: response regulator [Candidatus Nitrohelix vancouverensis]